MRIGNKHDSLAWSQFVAIYQPVIYRLARGRGLQHSDAEDLCQTVFISIAKASDDWEFTPGGPQFRNWLGRVVRNASLNALSRRHLDQATGSTSVLGLLNGLDARDEESWDSTVQHESRLEAFRWAAEQVQAEVSQATWIMFRETSLLGRPVDEVAEATGRSPGAVYLARYRIMQRIKEKIASISDFWSLS